MPGLLLPGDIIEPGQPHQVSEGIPEIGLPVSFLIDLIGILVHGPLLLLTELEHALAEGTVDCQQSQLSANAAFKIFGHLPDVLVAPQQGHQVGLGTVFYVPWLAIHIQKFL